MFDNYFNEIAVGEVGIFGWPWHGYVSVSGTGDLTLNTPKEQVPLGLKSHTYPNNRPYHEWQQLGTVLKFRDPRAPDVSRTPEQLSDDAEKGIEWRADVLFNPHEAILYGQARGARQFTQWIYHDGEENWLVGISRVRDSIYFTRLGLNVGEAANSEEYYLAELQGRYQGISGGYYGMQSEFVVLIDASSDGSKALFAVYRQLSRSYGESVATAFVEARITKSGDIDSPYFTVAFTEILSDKEESLIVKSNIVEDRAVHLETGVDITNWSRTAEVVEGETFYTFSLDAAVSYSQHEQSTGDGEPPAEPVQSIDYVVEQERIVNLFYDENEDIKHVTMHMTIEERWRGNVDGTPSETMSYSGTVGGNLPLDANLKIDFSGVTSGTLKVTTDMRVDGATKATSILSESVSSPYSFSKDVKITLWDVGQPSIYMSIMRDGHRSHSSEYEITVDNETATVGTSSFNTRYPQYAGTYLRNIPLRGFVSREGTGIYHIDDRLDVMVRPTRYAAQAICISTLLVGRNDQYLSKICAPFGEDPQDAPVYRDLRDDTLLFGSWNPVTGEIIRDTSTPVFWI